MSLKKEESDRYLVALKVRRGRKYQLKDYLHPKTELKIQMEIVEPDQVKVYSLINYTFFKDNQLSLLKKRSYLFNCHLIIRTFEAGQSQLDIFASYFQPENELADYRQLLKKLIKKYGQENVYLAEELSFVVIARKYELGLVQ